MKRLAGVCFGFVFYLYCQLTGKGWEHLLRVTQSGPSLKKTLLDAFLTSSLRMAFDGYKYISENRDRNRISDLNLIRYGDDTLAGYGDIDYQKISADLQGHQEEDHREKLAVLARKLISEHKPKRVLEIGAANGDLLAWLATDFPDTHFIGVALSVVNAKKKHSHLNLKNLEFIKGYALDLFDAGELEADMMLSASTFTLFTPAEFETYLSYFKTVQIIAINEPTWYDYNFTNDSRAYSRYLNGACWFHNYPGYFKKYGFDNIAEFDCYDQNRPGYNRVFRGSIAAIR